MDRIFYSSRRIIAVALFSAITSMPVTHAFGQGHGPVNEGTVIVVIRDESIFSQAFDKKKTEQDVNFYQLFLKGEDDPREMSYDDQSGHYELTVPEGAYQIVMQSALGEKLDFRRANVHVRTGHTLTLYISAIEGEETVCDKRLGFAALPSHTSGEAFRAINYDSFLVNRPATMVIKHCRRTVKKGRIHYKEVFLTHRNLTIYAKSATLDTNSFRFRGFGDVQARVDLNGQTCIRSGRSLLVHLRKTRQAGHSCRDLQLH